mmetsp:Transcript_32730/g.29613  ORF Transcript_32730/g.29613 Transcript_32730/m.29613 type:complete len:90 (-) Transcript_32730:1972-2241(-)
MIGGLLGLITAHRFIIVLAFFGIGAFLISAGSFMSGVSNSYKDGNFCYYTDTFHLKISGFEVASASVSCISHASWAVLLYTLGSVFMLL